MFLSKEQIMQSVQRLNNLNPFFGTTFLAFKRANLPVGETRSIQSIAILDTFLREFYQPIAGEAGFYTPFKTWNSKKKHWNSSLYANSLHVTATQTFSDVLIHPKGSEWGWKQNYKQVLNEKYLPDKKIPAFDLAVWLFHAKSWPEQVSGQSLIDNLITEFSLHDDMSLFNTTLPELAEPFLQEDELSEFDMMQITTRPPEKSPKEHCFKHSN